MRTWKGRMGTALTATLLLGLLAGGCGKREHYGAALALGRTTAVRDVLAEPARFDGQTLRLQGRIETECPSGCWFKLTDGGPALHVDLAPAGLAIPQKVGSTVTVEGALKVVDGTPELHASGLELR